MIKKILIMSFVLFIAVIIYSDTVVLKSGESVKGKIIEINESQVVLEIESGKLVIDKEKIRAIYYDDAKEENNKEEPKKKQKKEKADIDFSTDKEKNLLYDRYKTLIKAGKPLIIVGSIITFVPLIFATAPLLFVYSLTSGTAINNPIYITALSWYFGLIAVGLSMDIIAIVCFAIAGKTYREWKKDNKMSFNTGFKGDNINLSMSYRF